MPSKKLCWSGVNAKMFKRQKAWGAVVEADGNPKNSANNSAHQPKGSMPAVTIAKIDEAWLEVNV
jgi:hypothetical protein